MPPNGLIIYCGTILTDDNKEKKVNIDVRRATHPTGAQPCLQPHGAGRCSPVRALLAAQFEPFKPINTSLYLCDNKFHTEALQELLEADDKFGFIVMDGNGAPRTRARAPHMTPRTPSARGSRCPGSRSST